MMYIHQSCRGMSLIGGVLAAWLLLLVASDTASATPVTVAMSNKLVGAVTLSNPTDSAANAITIQGGRKDEGDDRGVTGLSALAIDTNDDDDGASSTAASATTTPSTDSPSVLKAKKESWKRWFKSWLRGGINPQQQASRDALEADLIQRSAIPDHGEYTSSGPEYLWEELADGWTRVDEQAGDSAGGDEDDGPNASADGRGAPASGSKPASASSNSARSSKVIAISSTPTSARRQLGASSPPQDDVHPLSPPSIVRAAQFFKRLEFCLSGSLRDITEMGSHRSKPKPNRKDRRVIVERIDLLRGRFRAAHEAIVAMSPEDELYPHLNRADLLVSTLSYVDQFPLEQPNAFRTMMDGASADQMQEWQSEAELLLNLSTRVKRAFAKRVLSLKPPAEAADLYEDGGAAAGAASSPSILKGGSPKHKKG